MHNKNRHFSQKKPTTPKKEKIGFTPIASKLCLAGLPLLLMGFCDTVARLHTQMQAGSKGIMLRLGYDFECIVAGFAILVGGVLLLDYMERKGK